MRTVELRGRVMTRAQHFQVARELAKACNAVNRAWLITGDLEGPLRPYGEATAGLRGMVHELCAKFAVDFPDQRNPYEEVPC